MLYVLAYVAGIGTGIGLMLLNRASIQKIETQRESEKAALANQVSTLCDQIQQHRLNESYWMGYEEGRKNPYNEAERFARTISSGRQNVKFQFGSKCGTAVNE